MVTRGASSEVCKIFMVDTVGHRGAIVQLLGDIVLLIAWGTIIYILQLRDSDLTVSFTSKHVDKMVPVKTYMTNISSILILIRTASFEFVYTYSDCTDHLCKILHNEDKDKGCQLYLEQANDIHSTEYLKKGFIPQSSPSCFI